jgi:ABC-type nitrate/sulfonate/bicarbonate transport system substrate-binding protein
MKKNLFLITLVLAAFIFFFNAKGSYGGPDREGGSIRIGYFHGSRFYPLFRALKNNYFEAEGLNVELFKNLKIAQSLVRVGEEGSTDDSLNGPPKGGQVLSGVEFIDEISKGNLEGACVGSASFIYAIQKKAPIVAVAGLAYSDPGRPSGGIVMRRDIKIDTAEDLKGKKIGISRHSESGIEILLRVLFKNIGLKSDDVEIVDLSSFFEGLRFTKAHGLSSFDKIYDLLTRGVVDGYFFRHYLLIKKAVTDGRVYLYKKFDWPESRLSFSVLVFKKDFVDSHFNELKRLVKAYRESLEFEHEEISEMDKQIIKEFEFQERGEFMGMGPPVTYDPPIVRQDLLNELQNLMFEHGFIKKKVNINDYIDKRFVD